MNFCCEHKSVQDFVAELLDEVHHAEHADVAVDADHGLKDGVKKTKANDRLNRVIPPTMVNYTYFVDKFP